MTTRQARSFAEISFLEAVARRARVDLVVAPALLGIRNRLTSRFLRLHGADRLVLEVPLAMGRKVWIPAGCRVGLAFSIGPYFLQAPTTTIGTCQYPLYETRRVEVLLVDRPVRIVATNRRENPRTEIDPHVFIFASLWTARSLAVGEPGPPRVGRLFNHSKGGMGIRLEAPLTCDAGTEMIVRLEQGRADEFPLYRAVLKHQTRDPDGLWLAGFGDVTELEPGNAAPLIETIAEARR